MDGEEIREERKCREEIEKKRATNRKREERVKVDYAANKKTRRIIAISISPALPPLPHPLSLSLSHTRTCDSGCMYTDRYHSRHCLF